MSNVVKIYWNSNNPFETYKEARAARSEDWTLRCKNLVEVFGVPGTRYTTNATKDFMEIQFKDSQDALLCKLML